MTIFHFVYSFREKKKQKQKQSGHKQNKNKQKTYISAEKSEIFSKKEALWKVFVAVLALKGSFLYLYKIWGGFVEPNKVGECISTKNKHDNNRFSRIKKHCFCRSCNISRPRLSAYLFVPVLLLDPLPKLFIVSEMNSLENTSDSANV